MARKDESTNRGKVDRSKPSTLSAHEGAEHRIFTSSRHCAICNLTFGSQEPRVFWGEKAAHPGCVKRVRRSEAA